MFGYTVQVENTYYNTWMLNSTDEILLLLRNNHFQLLDHIDSESLPSESGVNKTTTENITSLLGPYYLFERFHCFQRVLHLISSLEDHTYSV